MTTSKTRKCGFKDTTTGHPCDQDVDVTNAKCENGHVCVTPPVAAVSTPSEKNKGLHLVETSSDIEELAAPGSIAFLEAEVDEAYGKATEEFLNESIDVGGKFAFKGIRDVTTASGKVRKFAEFTSPDHEPLLRGKFSQ